MSETQPLPDMSRETDAALGELLMRRIAETRGENSRYDQLVKRMQADAAVFAQTMQTANAESDQITEEIIINKSFLRGDLVKYNEHNYWTIRQDKKKYGGEGKQHGEGELYSQGINGRFTRRVVIRNTGQLTAVHYVRRDYLSFDDELDPSNIICRDAADTTIGTEAAYEEWLRDLQAAAEKYTRTPSKYLNPFG